MKSSIGDIITGAFAIPLALSVARSQKLPVSAIVRWNIFGTLDLFAAVALGITSAAGSPIQLIHAGVGSDAMQYLPFCLVPTVLVPFYLITHGIIAAQLRMRHIFAQGYKLRATPRHGDNPRARGRASNARVGVVTPTHRPSALGLRIASSSDCP